jgi:hypothetical protein
MIESGADRLLRDALAFLRAPDWPTSRQVLEAHPEILNDAGYFILSSLATDPVSAMRIYSGLEEKKALELMAKHCLLIARCRQVGINQAFAELPTQHVQGTGPTLEGPHSPVAHRRSAQWPVFVGILALIVVAGLGTVLIAVRVSSGHRAISSGTNSVITSSQTQPSEQRAAESLSLLLAKSAADRNSVRIAASDVSRCGPDVTYDSQAFQNAARSRQYLLSQLAILPDRSALPSQLIETLTNAWQASAKADQYFAAWAQDENAKGCKPGDISDPNYQAVTVPNNEATAYKKTFVSLWSPIAMKYGLSTYQWTQL